jgi:SAM-dependent methyltransferase
LPADSVQPYDHGFEAYSAGWERVAFEAAHEAVLAHLPDKPGLVFDIGAGSGRDAAWFAGWGWSVVAVEPADRLRRHAQALHPSPGIAWEADRLPGLEKLLKRGVLADLIWLSAVWMHVAPADRSRAFRKLVTLLKPGGRLIMSLRHGPLPFDRPMHAVTSEEVERLAIEHGLNVRAVTRSPDAAGRADITWTSIVLDLPDDATGALPLVRGIILQDAKAATYKLALLRVIARIADQSASFARYAENHVELPLGLVALYWLRMFMRLVEEDIPQAPGHRGRAGLGFVKEAFWAMGVASPFELRPGATFAAPRGHAIAAAIGDAASTIATMPAHYLTFADKSPIFPTRYAKRFRLAPGAALTIDSDFLWTYGRTSVPLHLWMALRRLSAWIEPMLLAEWTKLIEAYARRQGREVPLHAIGSALRWIDPQRDTLEVRKIIAHLLDEKKPIYCVWSGDRITDLAKVDVDHCFPFAAWPCDDLWNLMPSTKRINNEKRDKLVTLDLLQRAESRIGDWWTIAYRDGRFTQRMTRFEEEARGTLPIEEPSPPTTTDGPGLAFAHDSRFFPEHATATLPSDAILDAMRYQRLRLHQDQQLPEWQGPRHKA